MVLDIEPEKILRETDLSHVKFELNHCALQLAVLGEVEAALELINFLVDSGIPSPSGYSQGLRWAWKEIGKWPKGNSMDEQSEQSFSLLRKAYEESAWGRVPEDCQTFDEKGLEACMKSWEDERYADASTGYDAMLKGERLVKALDISLKLYGSGAGHLSEMGRHSPKNGNRSDRHAGMEQANETNEWVNVSELNEKSASILSQIITRWNANQQIEYLTHAERLWPLYILGVIADAMGLDRQDLQEKGRLLVQTFSQRLQNGHAKTRLAGKSIRELLDIGNQITLHGPGNQYWQGGGDCDGNPDRPLTLFAQPASDSEVSKLEERLQVTLPHDFKDFLKISNGFGHDCDGIFNGYSTEPSIWGTSNVVWISEEYFQLPVHLLNIPPDILDLAASPYNELTDWDNALPLFDRVLQIGARDIDNIWLVYPRLVKEAREAYYEMYGKANKAQKKAIDRAVEAFVGSWKEFDRLEWCCATWASGGSACFVPYSSFANYLENIVSKSLESVDGDDAGQTDKYSTK